MIMGKLIQGCCNSRVMECCELPHSGIGMFHKGKFWI
jgi:hypothetical protein